MDHKLLMGYQGWFACAGDGSPPNSWIHWFRNNSPTATNATVDLWPDTSELDPDELFATSLTFFEWKPGEALLRVQPKNGAAPLQMDGR